MQWTSNKGVSINNNKTTNNTHCQMPVYSADKVALVSGDYRGSKSPLFFRFYFFYIALLWVCRCCFVLNSFVSYSVFNNFFFASCGSSTTSSSPPSFYSCYYCWPCKMLAHVVVACIYVLLFLLKFWILFVLLLTFCENKWRQSKMMKISLMLRRLFRLSVEFDASYCFLDHISVYKYL